MKRKISNYLGRNLKKERTNDVLSADKRSELMSKIRSRDTKLEKNFVLVLKKATRKKFETNVATIKGKPDIVFPKNRLCIFLDSDFWHGWYYPHWKHLLKDDFWREKIEKNRIRDRRTTLYLRNKRWKVLRLWEHEIKKDPDGAIAKVARFLQEY